jgi:para-nitrobenzyl esterase
MGDARSKAVFLWLALAFACVFGTGATASDPALVRAPSGPLQGIANGDYRAFLGVPYAKPPVGELRWAPPQPLDPWPSLLDASALRSKCIQIGWKHPGTVEGGEDCLYLNVYTPAEVGQARLPVMVWFHGGGWVAGSSQDVDPTVMVSREHVIVVTVNYRLGAFGFFASPALDAEDPAHTSGNYAIRDQQLALRWVQRNISAFGGDPQRVTLAGQSAGTISNFTHLVAPASQGLFHQVIAESSPIMLKSYGGGDWTRGVGGTRSLKDEEQSGASAGLFAALGCDDPATALACARGKPSTEVLSAINREKTRTPGWGEIVDGVVVPDSLPELIRRGAYAKLPILTGFNITEAGFGTMAKLANGVPPTSAADYVSQTRAMAHGEAILAQYPLANYSSPEDAWIARSSGAMNCSMLYTAHALSSASPIYMYEFDDMNPPQTLFSATVPPNVHPGAYHTAEIAYVFGRGYPNEMHPGAPQFDPKQQALSDRMIHYWASFVKTGEPDGQWKRAADSRSIFVLSPDGDRMLSDAEFAKRNQCDFWRSLVN